MKYEIQITHNGDIFGPWNWEVHEREDSGRSTRKSGRYGSAFSKDAARKKALKAKRSMENEDVDVTL